MKASRSKIGLFAILLFYSLLYVATTKEYPCDGVCKKIEDVSSSLHNNRTYVLGAYQCRDSVLCVMVRDSIPQNWDALADTACLFLRSQSLIHYRTVVVNQRQDTLAKKICP
jgi:hypothetical protein